MVATGNGGRGDSELETLYWEWLAEFAIRFHWTPRQTESLTREEFDYFVSVCKQLRQHEKEATAK
jgi:hypothetical protein